MRKPMKKDKLQVRCANSTASNLILTCRILDRPPCSRDSSNLQASLTVRPFLATSCICPLVHTFPCLGSTAGYVQTVSIHPTPSSEYCCHLHKPDHPNLPPAAEVWIRGCSPPLVQWYRT